MLSAFHRFLKEENATGMCVVDRLPFDRGYQYLQEKFQTGLSFPSGGNLQLSRIHLFASTCDGASHASSAIDIILGAFRYCVNQRERNIAPREMLPVIVGMMWHKEVGDTLFLREYGLLLRPKNILMPTHRQENDELTGHLTQLLVPSQNGA